MEQSPPSGQSAADGGASSSVAYDASAPPYPPPTYATQLTFQQAHRFNLQQQQHHHHQALQAFWGERVLEIEQTTDFKNHSLPLARIKKIMKADEDVRMISAEAPVVFAKACEIFILELTLRSWINTEENKRRMLQKNDIAAAITRTDIFDFLVDIVPRDDFLVDIVPRDELKDEGLGMGMGIPRGVGALPMMGGGRAAADSMPYYYVPQQPHQVGATDVYAAHHPHPGTYMSCQGQHAQQQQEQTPPPQHQMLDNG